MRAAIFYGPGKLEIENILSEEVKPGEIKVEVKAAATCGTDLKSYRRGHAKLFPVLPARFGHEFSGVVTEVGDGVSDFSVGMRVVAANTAPCGSCWACIINRQSLCENLVFLNGAFAQELIIPAPIVARNTYKIADALSFEAAAPLEPLATVVHGISEANIQLGDTVIVNGAGPIGLMFAKLASLKGAHVISVDRSRYRLQEAKKSGAEQVILLSSDMSAEDISKKLKSVTPGGRGADIAVEAVGLAEVWEQTVSCLRPGGTAVLFGGPARGSRFSVDAYSMHYEEYNLKGIFHHTPEYVSMAVDLLSTGLFDGLSLVTEIRPLDQLVNSLEDMAAGKGSKYILRP